MFHGAFADSVARLAADPEVDALAKGLAVAHAPARTTTGRYSVMNGRAGVGFDPDRLSNTVVTLRLGQGQGPAFFVGEAGLVVTNAQVVVQSNPVQVMPTYGVELPSRTLSRASFRQSATFNTALLF